MHLRMRHIPNFLEILSILDAPNSPKNTILLKLLNTAIQKNLAAIYKLYSYISPKT